jgi:hypothetical protein
MFSTRFAAASLAIAFLVVHPVSADPIGSIKSEAKRLESWGPLISDSRKLQERQRTYVRGLFENAQASDEGICRSLEASKSLELFAQPLSEAEMRLQVFGNVLGLVRLSPPGAHKDAVSFYFDGLCSALGEYRWGRRWYLGEALKPLLAGLPELAGEGREIAGEMVSVTQKMEVAFKEVCDRYRRPENWSAKSLR